jgi:hypothetical protein
MGAMAPHGSLWLGSAGAHHTHHLNFIVVCAYKRSAERLDFLIQNEERRLSALTVRLRPIGNREADR